MGAILTERLVDAKGITIGFETTLILLGGVIGVR